MLNSPKTRSVYEELSHSSELTSLIGPPLGLSSPIPTRRASLGSITCASFVGSYRSILTSIPCGGTRPLTRNQSNSSFNQSGFVNDTVGEDGPSSNGYNNDINENYNTEKSKNKPSLQVSIPSCKIGSPRFSVKGTPFLSRSSSRRHSDTSRNPYLGTISHPSLPSTHVTQSKGMLGDLMIKPDVFDILTLEALRDHPSVVRYSGSGNITAATPIRLVAEITSPSLVNYDLLSNFFLTFRSFLDTSALMHMLIARLEWSLSRLDSTGTIVSVRTFVAIRHWIINYFLDDFLYDWKLRKLFCDLVNDFVSNLIGNQIQFKVAIKILGELKKCWIKVCGAHWECPELDIEQCIPAPIGPNGIADSNHLFPDANCQTGIKSSQLPSQNKENMLQPNQNESNSNTARKKLPDINLPRTPIDYTTILINKTLHRIPLSPQSVMSFEVIPCEVVDQPKVIKAESSSIGHLKPVKSLLDLKKGFAASKKTNKSNEEHPNNSRQKSEVNSDNIRSCPPDKERNRYPNHLATVASESSLLNKKGRQTGSSFMNLGPPLPNKPLEFTSASNLKTNTKESHAIPSPGIKKLFGNLRRAISNRTDHIMSSSRTQRCIPHLLQPRSRDKSIEKTSNFDYFQAAHSIISSVKSPERYDLLSSQIGKELQSIIDCTQAVVDIRSLKSPVIHTAKAENSVLQCEASSQYSRTTCQGMTNALLTPVNGTSLTGFSPSGYSYEPSNQSSVTACMHASSGPTPPTTPDTSLMASRNRSNPLGLCSRDKTSSIEETPSLFIDPYYSEDEKSQLSFKSKGLRLSPSNYSIGTQASPQLHPPHHKTLKKWISNPSFDSATFSDNEVKTPKILSDNPPFSLHLRPLRRRPGGYLRSVNNPEDIGLYSNHGTISTNFSQAGSTRYSEQHTSFALGKESMTDDNPKNVALTTSFLQMEENQSRTPVIPLDSPIFTGSFENEVRFLAQLPDTEDDDGTVEAALLKLEGKFAKPLNEASDPYNPWSSPSIPRSTGISELNSTLSPKEDMEKRRNRRYVLETNLKRLALLSSDSNHPQIIHELSDNNNLQKPAEISHVSLKTPDSPGKTSPDINSCTSNSDDRVNFKQMYPWLHRYTLQGSNEELPNFSSQSSPDISNSICNLSDFKPNWNEASSEKIHYNRDISNSTNTMENHDAYNESLDVDKNILSGGSDLTSEFISDKSGPYISWTIDDKTNRLQNPPFEVSIPSVLVSQVDLAQETIDETKALNSNINLAELEGDTHIPIQPVSQSQISKPSRVASISTNPLRAHQVSDAPTTVPATIHLPFILAFSSDDLAQQFTIVEKELASELNWRDLVEMKWKDSPIDFNVRSWAKFLYSYDSLHGVEAIISRSNLMIKWVVSECLLTTDLSERVCCLIKFIHIADKCLKYRNFATMSQIVTALMTQDVARLTKTWRHVPSSEMLTFKKLTNLLDKSNNYFHLRAEMEGVSIEQGCVPLVQIYTHDLLVNYGNPIFVTSSSKAVPLINFKRYHTNAMIIKNLLRLLDASRNYKFNVNESIIQRCYWIAALSDEQILERGRLIQS